MVRPWREEIIGGYYHVIARGNNREFIFKKDIDKGYFLKLLNETRQTMRYKLMGYVLMDNHYHLLIQTMDIKLQKIMHQVNNKYSKYFNAMNGRCGHVFQGRYKASPIRNEQYLIKVLAYIHQNPVKAGLCGRVNQYKWSSDKFYRKKLNGFIDTATISAMIENGFERKESTKKYKEIMDEVEETDYDRINEVGDKAYELMMKNSRISEKRPSLKEILTETVADAETEKMIIKGTRKSKYKTHKLNYAQKAQEYGYTLKEIGLNIGQSGNSIWKLLHGE